MTKHFGNISLFFSVFLPLKSKNGKLLARVIQKTKVSFMFDILKNTKEEKRTGKKLREQLLVQAET